MPTVADVLSILEDNKDERGIAHYNKRYGGKSALTSFGIGLTRLRKIGKQIGRNRDLALQLWESNVYEAKVLSFLVDDPKQIDREQAERQVEEVDVGQLAHVFSSCDATLAKAPLARGLAEDWIASDDPIRRGCGYGLLYELSKSKKKSAPADEDFLEWIDRIERTFPEEGTDVLMAMATALMGIGKRNRTLHAAALRVAKKIGPIDFDPTGSCDPMDVSKHLQSPALEKKLGIRAIRA